MIEIDYTSISKAVRTQLAIIGKHRASPKGGTLYSTADLTTIEADVIPMQIIASAQTLVSALSPVVTSYSTDGGKLTFEVSASRWGEALPVSFADSVKAFVVANVTGDVLSMTLPDAAAKYAADAKNQLAALTSIALAKQAPKPSTAEYSDVSGKMYNDDGTEFTNMTTIPRV